jgi:hypothetical protein
MNLLEMIFGKKAVGLESAEFEAKILSIGAVISPCTSFLSSTMKTSILVPNDSFLASLGNVVAVPSPQKTEVKKFGNDYYFIDNSGFMLKTTAS